MSQEKPMKWHSMNEIAAQQLANATQTPNLLYPVQLPLNLAPSNLQAMPGAVSYFASNFLCPVTSKNGLTIGGEVVIARTDANLIKNYNFMVATSNNGDIFYCGPFKNFPAHHIQSSSPVVVESLFAHSPAGKSITP